MIKVTVTTDGKPGMGSLVSSFNKYSVNIPKYAKRGVWLFTNKLAERLRLAAPVGGSGYMRSKKGTFVKGTQKSSTWQVMMPYYTTYLESGTTPHYIPRMGKTVNWARKHGMTFSYFRSLVAAKGTVGHPFIERVIQQSLDELGDTIGKQVRRGFKK